MPDKLIQDLAYSEIKKMLDDSDTISTIDHPFIKGKIREIGFGHILQRFLPANYLLGSGKINDCLGNTSNEIDLLIYNSLSLPPLMFGNELDIFPLESVFYSIEVKSKTTTTRDTIRETIEKAKKTKTMMFLNNYGPGPIKTYPVATMFSYGAKSEIDVFQILKEEDPNIFSNPALNVVCIANMGYWYFSEWQGKKYWAKVKPTKENYEILCFIGGIVNTLIGPNKPLYGYYLLKPEAETEKEILFSE
jgi:hypothetical protein